MSIYKEVHVITGAGPIVWNGITQPETKNDPKTGGSTVIHSLKIALLPGSPEFAELQALAEKELREGMWKGKFPSNGLWPLNNVDAGEIDPALVGRVCVNAKTTSGVPQVFDANGLALDALAYGPMFYAGAIVKIMLHAFSYDNKNKGVAFGLDGVQIIDATVPRLAVSGGIDATGAFAPVTGPPVTGPPVTGPPVTGPPVTGPPVTGPPVTGPPVTGPPVTPAPDFLAGPGAAGPPPPPPVGPQKIMTPAAIALGYTYEALKAANWTDAQMIAAGHLVEDIPF